ncbi:hypothetical protein VY88_15145 [Azospirillum thiophilum]|uniref:Membrane transport protein MMPL domain-containing protein n=1 Tax=Azospirillum thiophilum TaxID=528244 RepID=A0AAC8W0J7_9PROT|nr:hypothetical protein [Azospirillum thiophilum]ALG72919.1 hypothetical protein AL072_18360 [Azospirillum thiophilum]KJR64165.1 hypothetical protein VY88_15145 [Azospirillum thiophilum]
MTHPFLRPGTARLLAFVWLLVVVAGCAYLGWRVQSGMPLRTDLLALLPREEQDPTLQRANDAVSRALGRRIIALVGSEDRAAARGAATTLARDLIATGLVATVNEGVDPSRLRALGALYFPHRHGLLSDADRTTLLAGRGEDLATRALSQLFGVGGIADAGLLRNDPFLLLPSFLTALPFPLSRLTLDDGMLTVTEKGTTWILVGATLSREPFELEVQSRVVEAFDASASQLAAVHPDLQIKRLGAVFFAQAGASTAIDEATLLSMLELGGTVLLILVVFRRVGPLLHNVLALGVGIAMGFTAGLLLFGELHVAALLFGTSLIGVAVDYGLHYSSGLFDESTPTPADRLAHVLPAITLGLTTTLIGYATLALAPFPGLRQIAVFSAAGLVSAFATVVLWLPLLDRGRTVRHGARMMRMAERLWTFWETPRLRPLRLAMLAALALAGTVGMMRLHVDDDVRRLQPISPDLARQQAEIQQLIGATTAQQFVLVRAPDDEGALRTEEELADRLVPLVRDGAIAGFQSPAAFVPSAIRQGENMALVRDALETPFLATYRAQTGLPEPTAGTGGSGPAEPLRLNDAVGTVPMLGELVLAPGLHAVTLQGLTDPAALRAALSGMDGVRLVDPAGDFSALLGKYRERAVLLVAVSALLMVGPLAWRYGWRRAGRTMFPPLSAVTLAPALVALTGESITFFHIMPLILILAIGVDYAIFCAEAGEDRQPVTLLAVWLATLTTLLSFGLLVVSKAGAVHGFGLTMLFGILLAFLLAPLAARPGKRGGTRTGCATKSDSCSVPNFLKRAREKA